jgi:hypothetical protein
VFKDGLRHTVMDKRHGAPFNNKNSTNSSSSSAGGAAAQVGNARYFSRAELRDLFTLGAPGETRALKQIEQRHGTLQQVQLAVNYCIEKELLSVHVVCAAL